jgi:hypothetical protein
MPISTTSTNTQTDCGHGEWVITIYKPDGHQCGPYRGFLQINKDFHTVITYVKKENATEIRTVASIPSQNVAFVENTLYHKPSTSP